MITQRVWFAVIPVAMLMAGSTACVSKAMAAQASYAPATTPSITDRLGLPSSPAEPHLDVYGNEIEDAITDYRIDTGGVVYERHSPDTEVPRLSPPMT
jgi:hypothetical protein